MWGRGSLSGEPKAMQGGREEGWKETDEFGEKWPTGFPFPKHWHLFLNPIRMLETLLEPHLLIKKNPTFI